MFLFIKNIFQDIFFDTQKKIFFTPNKNIRRQAAYKKQHHPWFLSETYVLLKYDSSFQEALHRYKFFWKKENKQDFFQAFSWVEKKFFNQKKEDTYITSIPSFFLSRFFRPVNHGKDFAKMLEKKVHFSYLPIGRKIKHTKQQSKLSYKRRKTNILGVYKIKKKYELTLRGKTIIIVDDVISTGSTANEFARVLLRKGAKEVLWIFLASNNYY